MPDEKPIVIKKYANRRLHDGRTSCYVTLYDLAQMIRRGVQFRVVDAKTGDDITQTILTQIVMDEEAHGERLLPLSFLRELLSMYGQSLQAVVPLYLDAAMNAFAVNQQKLCEIWSTGLPGKSPDLAEHDATPLRPVAMPTTMSRGGSSTSAALPTTERSIPADPAVPQK